MKAIAASSTRAVELVDLRVDLALAQRERHADDGLPVVDPDRRRRHQVLVGADRLAGDVGRPAVERERAVDVAGRARRQQARREQVALAGGEQAGAGEDVDVLADDAAQPDQQVVVERRQVGGAARLDAGEVLDDAAGRQRRARRLAFDVG